MKHPCNPENQSPDKLAVLASIVARMNAKASSRSRSLGAINRRNAAIVDVLDDGHTPGAVGQAAKLTERTVQDIAVEWRKQEVARPISDRKPVEVVPLRGPVLFDQASAMALAIDSWKAGFCRWPLGEGDGFRFCGAPAAVGYRRGTLTYCATCADRAFASRTRSVVAEAA